MVKKIYFSLSAPLRLCISALKRLFFLSALKFLTLALTILLFTGCQRSGLDVQNQYISYRDLASYRIGTPDWRKECPDFGQRIIITWNIPACCCPGELSLLLHLQFGNFEDTVIERNCIRSRGCYTYELINCDYTEKGGIASYKVEICCDGVPIKCLQHLLWVDKINLSSTPCTSAIKSSEALLPQVEPNDPTVPAPSEP